MPPANSSPAAAVAIENHPPSVAPVLVLACGNPSRGDDALGPLFIEALEREYQEAIAASQLECRWAYQWQIEDALALVGRKRVVFVDAVVANGVSCAIAAAPRVEGRGALSHALSPGELLAVYRQLYGEPEFSVEVLGIGGVGFELGEGVSGVGETNLAAALKVFARWVGAALGSGE
ncbi:MAG: hydrogenase maturation protease [Betaproteobacteria bacterium]|nr:hydrogenase maturation protease [Betaproteobacteria bacterium]